jgi:hypothetical protein
MKPITITILIFLSSVSYSQVKINEIQSSNTNTIKDDFGQYEDWIEIFNPNDTAFDIGGMVLKDNVDVWRIPKGEANTIIKPKGFFLLWADDEEFQGKFHTNFKLSAANGEFLGLFKSDSITVVDSINFPPLLSNQSYGRCNDNWIIFNNATPLKQNDCKSSGIDILKQNDLLIYYSIVSDNIYVELPKLNGDIINVFLYSADGRLWLNKNFDNKSFTFNISNLNKALYIIKILDKNVSYSGKIIKE